MLLKRFITPLIIVASVNSCRSSTFTGGENEKQPAISEPIYIPDSVDRDVAVFHGVYDVLVRSRKTKEIVCQGIVRIEASLRNNVITGTVPCTAIGAKELVIGDGIKKEKVDLSDDETKAKKLDTRIRRALVDGPATFSPFKPDIIGPIIQDPQAYADIDQIDNLSVKLKTNTSKTGFEEATGSVHTKMIGINETYTPRNFPQTFRNVVHYQINATGFDQLSDKSIAKLYEVNEYRWSVQPMRLLNIHIEGPVRDFEKSALKGFLGNLVAFEGGIVIDMDLRELLPISDNPLQEALNKKL